MRNRARRHRSGHVQRRHNAALRGHLRLLAPAVAQATDAIVITTAVLDPPGPAMLYVNPAFCAMTGYTAAELLGRSPRLLQGPATDRAELARVRHALQHEQPYHGEIINYRKDGQPYHMRWHLAPVRSDAGVVTHWLAIQRDVSAEHAAAAERARLAAQAEAALHVREQFLSIASHELRTPLTSLIGYAYLLPRASTHGTAGITALSERITHQARRLETLIGQLLDVSRLQQGRFVLDRKPLDLVALVAQVVDAFRVALPADSAPLLTLARPDAPMVLDADGARLEQVLLNLLTNAAKYSPPGSPITVSVAARDGHAVVAVADRGIGIPADAQARLFEPFYRAENVPAQSSGFGIGLYVVQQIVERHAGRLRVDSTEGGGTTVLVALPLPPPDA